MRTINSHEYLRSLATAEKLDRSQALSEDIQSFLCVRIQKRLVYIDVTKIGEVLPFSNVSPVGHASSWFEGLLKIQGEIYGVLDISTFLGHESKVRKKGFVIAFSEANENIGIVVEDLLGLHSFKTSKKKSEDGYLDVFRGADKDIHALSIDRLLYSPDFASISIF